MGRVFNNLTDNVVKNREKLEGSLVAANSANTLKTRMISVLSHEMRTPLNGVFGATELLQCTDLTNQQSRYVEIISSSSQTLKEHVNDVLDVGRLESGSIHLNRSTFDIDSLLNEIIAENEPTLLKQGNTVVLQTPDNHPLVVETDLKLIRNIATNLIGNATKFTTGGKVEIILKLTSENELELRVSDNGPGIAKEDFEKIFDPFITLSSNYRRAVDGTGLGLSIVASATKIIGGEYGVESKIGKGSTFWVRFPVLVHAQSPAEQGEIIDLKSYTQDNASGSRRVLIVDDNDINCAVLGEMVKKLGHHVSVANGGKETLNIAMHQPFDLIMLDISMPDLDGIQVAKMLRKNEGCNQSTKIVAQTAHASAEDYDRFLKAGMQDVVIKPIKLKDVKRVICEQIAENLEI